MKNILIFALTLVLSLGTIFGLTACGSSDNDQTGHKHTFATEWSKDESNHWKVCTGENCKEVSDKAEHNFESSVCSVCGFEKTTDNNDGTENGGNNENENENNNGGQESTDVYTVTQEVWENSFKAENFTNVKMVGGQDGNWEWQVYIDGDIFRLIETRENGGYHEEIYDMENNLCFYRTKKDDKYSKRTATVSGNPLEQVLLDIKDKFSIAVYNQENKAYTFTADNVAMGEDTLHVVSFKNDLLLGVEMQTTDHYGKTTYKVTFDSVEVTIPTDDMVISYKVTEEKWEQSCSAESLRNIKLVYDGAGGDESIIEIDGYKVYISAFTNVKFQEWFIIDKDNDCYYYKNSHGSSDKYKKKTLGNNLYFQDDLDLVINLITNLQYEFSKAIYFDRTGEYVLTLNSDIGGRNYDFRYTISFEENTLKKVKIEFEADYGKQVYNYTFGTASVTIPTADMIETQN